MNQPKIRGRQRLGSLCGERIRRWPVNTARVLSLSPTGGEGWGEGEGRANHRAGSESQLSHAHSLISLPPLVRQSAPSPWPSPAMGERGVAFGRVRDFAAS